MQTIKVKVEGSTIDNFFKHQECIVTEMSVGLFTNISHYNGFVKDVDKSNCIVTASIDGTLSDPGSRLLICPKNFYSVHLVSVVDD